MRIAVISDIHSNQPALEAVLEAIDAVAIDAIWSLGDLVGYGASPDACVALVKEHCSLSLAGNHDLVVSGVIPVSAFSSSAAVAARWTAKTIKPETQEFLKTLSVQGEAEGIGLYHASPRDPVWEYVLSDFEADLCFDVVSERISLIGHSHVALSFQRIEKDQSDGGLRKADEVLEIGQGQWLINPGSVGQPRDRDPRASWLELDTDAWTAHWHRTTYDIDQAASAIRAAGLPERLAKRLYDAR